MKWLFLFLALPCLAQLPVVPDITPKSSAVDIPTSLGGMAFRLKSSDNVVGNNTTTWVDEIAGRTYTNTLSASNPTNAAIGVWCTKTHFMHVDLSVKPSWGYAGTQQVMIIYQEVTGAADPAPVVGSDSANFFIGTDIAPNGFSSETPQVRWVSSNPSLNNFHDMIAAGGSPNSQCYSNGVAGNNPSSGGIAGMTLDQLFKTGSTTPSFQGYLTEVIIWTNATGFTSTQVSNLHYYATNISAAAPYSP